MVWFTCARTTNANHACKILHHLRALYNALKMIFSIFSRWIRLKLCASVIFTTLQTDMKMRDFIISQAMPRTKEFFSYEKTNQRNQTSCISKPIQWYFMNVNKIEFKLWWIQNSHTWFTFELKRIFKDPNSS